MESRRRSITVVAVLPDERRKLLLAGNTATRPHDGHIIVGPHPVTPNLWHHQGHAPTTLPSCQPFAFTTQVCPGSTHSRQPWASHHSGLPGVHSLAPALHHD